MKLMFPEKIRVAAVFAILAVCLIVSGNTFAQKKSTPANKAPASKKSTASTKKASDSKKATASNKKTTTTKKTSASSKNAAASKKSTASKKSDKHAKDARKDPRKDQKTTDRSRDKDRVAAKGKNDPKKGRETKKEASERRRREEERRQAIIAEQRRREQAAREARERRLAFERGLRTETVANISNDKIDGEDLNIRRAAVEALGNRAGSIVVMEAQTGKVLTVVNQDWAIRSSIRPCSTIKLVTGVAALNEDVIDKSTGAVRDTSTRRNLDDAIAYSDNPYFQRAGVNVGSPKVIDYAKRLGLGAPTGINLENEVAGKLPFGNNSARIYSHGDDFEVSTIQLAVMVSAITNGGHRVLPRIPRNSIEQVKFQTFYKANVDLPQQNVRRVIPGMIGAAEYGTARRVDASLGIAGKTGSCIGKGSWVGLFASVAPIESPKYAIAVITRGQNERGKYAAEVAGKIYKSLSANIVRTDRNLAQTEFKIAPRTSSAVNSTTAVAEEDDDETANDGVAAGTEPNDQSNEGRDIIVVGSAPKDVDALPAQKKLIQKTGDSKPVFQPVVIPLESNPALTKRERIVKPQ